MKKLLKGHKSEILQTTYVAALIVVIIPLLMVAPYDRPSADDWSYGAAAYKSLLNGEGILGVVRSSFSVVYETYMTWEGRYSCVFFDSIMPGIWNESFYAITPFILIFSLIVCEMYLIYALLGRDNLKYLLPITVPGLIMQILYIPSIVESFYWYTGAMNYTFINSLSMLFIGIFFAINRCKFSKKKNVSLTVVEVILAVIIGGGNFSTSIYSILTVIILFLILSLKNNKVDIRSCFIISVLLAGFLIAVFAPGNAMRISGNFSGQTHNPIIAVWMSISGTCNIIWQWSNARWFRPVFVMIALFLCHAVKNMDWSFRFPGLFTFLTTGVYSSQIVATMYVDGTVGGGRSVAILMYSYWIWVTLNMLYWIGWLYRKTNFKIKNIKIFNCAKVIFANSGKIVLALAVIMAVGMYLTHDIRSVSSVRAIRDIRLGLASGYAEEWDYRYSVLHDDSQTTVSFKRLENRPETILYCDFEYEEPYTWVNSACATYYGKDSITVIQD